MKAVVPSNNKANTLEAVLIRGDLSSLTPEQRTEYYMRVCESVGLNPLTRPFEYIRLNGKEVLYAKRDATDQLRKNQTVSIKITARDTFEGVYVVTAQASMPGGRVDESTGAVTIKGLSGDNLANAFMKAETKAKRRVTLSICGLGLLDETEVETIATAEAPKPAPAEKTSQKTIPAASQSESCTPAQQRAFWVMWKKAGYTEEMWREELSSMGFEHTSDVPKKQMSTIIESLQKELDESR